MPARSGGCEQSRSWNFGTEIREGAEGSEGLPARSGGGPKIIQKSCESLQNILSVAVHRRSVKACSPCLQLGDRIASQCGVAHRRAKRRKAGSQPLVACRSATARSIIAPVDMHVPRANATLLPAALDIPCAVRRCETSYRNQARMRSGRAAARVRLDGDGCRRGARGKMTSVTASF